jgi:GrpB-like predicted nucleotidyltransferase (UPF0157 family)
MTDPIIVVPYNPDWPRAFADLGRRLRTALGPHALRIDHIGSTAIPNLAAKPVLDVLISVANLEPIDAYRPALESAGFSWRPDNPDLTKRYFREQPGAPRTHIHVHRAGSWGEQFLLLFRDYLRAHPADAAAYARLKYQLAQQYRHDRPAYVDAKSTFIWTIIQQASDWSQQTDWQPGPTDC